VKFAKYEPVENELRDLHGSALRLVEETEPVEIKAEGGKAESGNELALHHASRITHHEPK
jgi:hypothetical protein